jgi:hypothetical protein
MRAFYRMGASNHWRHPPASRESLLLNQSRKRHTAKAVPQTGKKEVKKMSEKKSKSKSANKADAKNKNAQTENGAYEMDSAGNIFAKEGAVMEPRRPPDAPLPDSSVLMSVIIKFNDLKYLLEIYAQHLRPLDRRRLNGVGIKKLGFVESAYDIARGNPEFLPHYLTLQKFTDDNVRLNNLKLVNTLAKQVEELLWNITMESADILYTNALEYYSSVQDAAKRRVDAAEALYNALSPFFKSRGRSHEEEAPTEKELKRDFDAYLHGKRDGVITVSNLRPKIQAGEHEVIDKKFTESEQFKASEEGEIKE